MKSMKWLAGLSLVLGLAGPGAASAASSCLQLQVTAPETLCEGKAATISGSVENSCPSNERATLSFSVDERKIPGNASIAIAGDATMTGQWTFTVPPKTPPGTHVLTLTATDAAGNQVTTDVTVTVAACSSN